MNKMKKIILAVISIFMFVLLFSINDVQARGLVYQTWSMDGLDGAIVYREYTTPYEATLKNIRSTTQLEKVSGAPQTKYWNRNAGQYIESKWVYNDGTNDSFYNNDEFNYYSFSSVGLRIYGDFELSEYDLNGTSMGYMTIGSIGSKLPENILGSASRVKTSVNDIVDRKTKLQNDTKVYDMRLERFSDPTYVKYSNGTHTYRIALVAPDGESKKVTPIYVVDRVLSKEMVSAIKEEAIDSTGKSMFHETMGYTNCLRISSLAKTAQNAYNDGVDDIDTAYVMSGIARNRQYSSNSKGLADNKALGSALNLYDNILVFPESSTRTVYYRYVNIGTQRQVSAEAIENAEQNKKTAPQATYLSGMYIANYNEFDSTDVASTIDVTTDNNNPYKSDAKMEYMGYYVAESTSKGKAEANISTLVNINSALNPSTTYTSPDNTPENDEHIVVEIYYREKTDWETEEHHLMYDENGQYTGQSGVTIKENIKEDVDNVTYTEDRKITIEGYKYVGIKSSNVDLTKDNNADGIVDVGELSTYEGTNSVTLDRDNRYAFYAYSKKKLYYTDVVHVLYDEQIGTSEIIKTDRLAIIEDEPCPKISTLDYDCLGVLRDYTGSNIPPRDSSWNGDKSALQTTINDADKTIYVAYNISSVQVIERHILYDINGDLKEVKSESSAGTASSFGGVTVSVDTSLKEKYDYKGYLQTLDATYPEKAIAYVSEDYCIVESKDLKVKTVYVNFMYKEKVKSKKLDPPDIEIGGNLSVDLIDDPTIDDPKTLDCEQLIFKDKDNRTFTTTSGNKLKLGITDLKTRYIAGLAVKNEVAPKSNLITYAIIQPNITSYGSNKDGKLQAYSMKFNTKYQVYTFIIPYISTKYEIEASRVYKLSNSKIYDTDSGKDTVGSDLLTKTGDNPYTIAYDLSQVEFNINKTKAKDYYINFESNNPIEAEINIENGMYSCKDIAFHNIDPENPDIYCNESEDSLLTTEIESVDFGLASIAEKELKWLIGKQEEGNNITQLKITAHVYPTEGYEQGVIKTERKVEDKIKHIYYMFNNDTTNTEATIKNWFMRKFQQIINGIKQAIAKLLETDYKETVFWDLEDEAMTSMNVSARNFLQQEDMMLFKLKLLAQTSGYELILKDNNTIVAKTEEETGVRYFNIDSTNFSMTSRNDGLAVVSEEHTFKGNVDLTNIGGMNITPEGKKMYEEGFVLKGDLDDGISTTDNLKALTSKNSTEAEIEKNAINGIRILYGLATYKPESGKESSITGSFQDNVYHSSSTNPLDTIYYFTSKPEDKTNDYNSSKENSDIINIYTPIKLDDSNMEIKGDHVDEEPISQLEKGVAIGTTKLATIESGFHFYMGLSKYNVLNSDSDHKYNDTVDTLRFLKGYYVKFSFDVKDLKFTIADNDADTVKTEITNVAVGGSTYKGGIVKANTWIYVELPENAAKREEYRIIQINARGINTADAKELSYTVRAVANNINRELSTKSFAESRLAFYNTFGNICNDKINLDHIVITDDTPVYYDEVTKKVTIEQVDRMFDFRVTDVNDVDWKNVFRNKDTTHNGVAYYVGDKKWVSSKTEPVSRTTKEIGTDPITTLPIGPNKNTDITYKKAPKLGYRISFDIKVSGEEKAREVKVKPSFYFVTDNGNIKDEIKLYYKNDNNIYLPVDNYKLSFTPNDGYRLLDAGIEHLASKEIALGTVSDMTLKYDTMSITTEDYQVFYGEFKLPNTTIAVKKDDAGNYDPTKQSNILKDGYIAVKFDITTTYESATQELKYDRPMDKKDTVDTVLKKLLVTQWSFEGFLGSRYKDKLNNANIQLENKNKLNVSNEDIYEQVIGTVVLFDSDERAASDFN